MRRVNNKIHNVSFALIIINIIVFILTYLLYQNSVMNLNQLFGLNPITFLKYKFYWTPLTHMFAHSGIRHLFFNMFMLFMFSHSVESKLGSRKFILYYLITGSLAGLFSLLFYILLNVNVLLVGASGAIYAILFAYAVLFPHRKIYFFGIVPISPPLLIAIYAGYNIIGQIIGRSNIAYIAHLSGFLFAYIYFRLIFKIDPIFIFKNYRRFQN